MAKSSYPCLLGCDIPLVYPFHLRWQPPTNYPTSGITKDEMQVEASRLLARIEQAKNRGEDYKLEDILTLRKACAAGGGITVDTRTVGGR